MGAIIWSKEFIVKLLNNNKLTRNFYPHYILLKKNLSIIFGLFFKKKPFFLEIHMADHCNLNCYGCSNYSPVSDKKFINIEELKKNLEYLKKVSKHFKEVRLMGGEPLLNKNIGLITTLVRDAFKSSQVSIITNGLLIKKMDEEFWESIIKNDVNIRLTQYQNVKMEEIIKILNEKRVKYPFYATRIMDNQWEKMLLNEKGGNALRNYYFCGGYQTCWQLYDNKIITCATCAYSNKLNKQFGTNFKIHKNDYLNIDYSLSRVRLMLFSLRIKKFCRYCLVPREKIRWQISSCSESEWIDNTKKNT